MVLAAVPTRTGIRDGRTFSDRLTMETVQGSCKRTTNRKIMSYELVLVKKGKGRVVRKDKR